jgi:gamma-glutamylcysteine synthetase
LTPQQITERFLHQFPNAITWRTVGREAEHPVVFPDGTAADIAALWPYLIERNDFRVLREAEIIVALEGPSFAFTSEVGKGTIEIITSPQRDLHALCACYEQARDLLLEAAEKAGVWVLGYGIQPRSAPTPELMTSKQRYGVLLDVLGPDWLWFTLTASDQVHVSITASEFVPFTNLGNLLAPITIALCANSPIFTDLPSPWCSAREGGMGQIHAEHSRHGMPRTPIRSAEDHITRLLELPHLMLKREGVNYARTGRFNLHLDMNSSLDPDQLYADFLHHEHYVWHSARPRSAHGTIELRAAGQQPPSEHMAATAFSLGCIQAGARIIAAVDELLGDEAWRVMRDWHADVLRLGLQAEEPVSGLIERVLALAAQALEDRGIGEASHLDPLFRRLHQRENPANHALKAFESEGMEGMLSLIRCT